MGHKSIIAIVVGAAVLLAAGLVTRFHHPRKPVHPVRIQQMPRVTEIVGVGIALRMDTQAQAAIVQDVIANTPAAEAGITRGLMVSKIDGVSMEGRPLAELVNLIRGPVGTTVQLELIAPDRSQTNTVELIRRKIKF